MTKVWFRGEVRWGWKRLSSLQAEFSASCKAVMWLLQPNIHIFSFSLLSSVCFYCYQCFFIEFPIKFLTEDLWQCTVCSHSAINNSLYLQAGNLHYQKGFGELASSDAVKYWLSPTENLGPGLGCVAKYSPESLNLHEQTRPIFTPFTVHSPWRLTVLFLLVVTNYWGDSGLLERALPC